MPLFQELGDDTLPTHRERARIRIAAGWSQTKLAQHLGCAQRNISNWERRGQPQPWPVHRAIYRLALKQLEQIALVRALEEVYAEPLGYAA